MSRFLYSVSIAGVTNLAAEPHSVANGFKNLPSRSSSRTQTSLLLLLLLKNDEPELEEEDDKDFD